VFDYSVFGAEAFTNILGKLLRIICLVSYLLGIFNSASGCTTWDFLAAEEIRTKTA
jgi:hypothetical protein